MIYDVSWNEPRTDDTSTLSRLRPIVGRDVRITSSDGATRRGVIAVVTRTHLIVTGSQHASVPINQITTVTEVSHRIRNGMLYGFAAGGGVGEVGFFSCGDRSGCGARFVGYSALGVGVGAAIGALMNLDDDRDLLFDASRRTTTVSITPLLARARRGAVLTVTWR